MDNEAVKKLLKYMDTYLTVPNLKMPKHEFEERIYSRWTANEILDLLISHPNDDVDTLIFLFIVQTEHFIHIAKDIVSASIFLTAKNTALKIKEVILQ